MKKVLLLFFFIPLTFRIHAQQLTNADALKLEKELETVFLDAVKAAESLDYDRLASTVMDGRKAGFIVGGIYYVDFADLLQNARIGSQGVSSQKIKLVNNKITILAPVIGIVSANGTAEISLTSGQTFSAPFFWTFVYEKIEGHWKMIHSHQSNARQ